MLGLAQGVDQALQAVGNALILHVFILLAQGVLERFSTSATSRWQLALLVQT